MAYIKYGVVTKIETISDNQMTKIFLDGNFNLDLYDDKNNKYYLKPDILNDNLIYFRKEILELTKGRGDSIDCYEAFYLDTTPDKLLKNKIIFCDDYDRYYFFNKQYKFETDIVNICEENIHVRLNLISVFWDTNRVEFEGFIVLGELFNNLIRKHISNILKDASFLVVV